MSKYTTATGDEGNQSLRIPQSDEKQSALRNRIAATLRTWGTSRYTASVGDYLGEGDWQLILIKNTPDDGFGSNEIQLGHDLPPMIDGTISIFDREGTDVIAWHLPEQEHTHEQANDATFQPPVFFS